MYSMKADVIATKNSEPPIIVSEYDIKEINKTKNKNNRVLVL